jgi:hypothetical protein
MANSVDDLNKRGKTDKSYRTDYTRPRSGSVDFIDNDTPIRSDGAFFFLTPPDNQAPAQVSLQVDPESGSVAVGHPELSVFNPPGSYRIKGVDVSSFDGVVDWQQVRNAGIAFFYIKATEGANKKDPVYIMNLSKAHSAGLSVGAYLFFHIVNRQMFKSIISGKSYFPTPLHYRLLSI